MEVLPTMKMVTTFQELLDCIRKETTITELSRFGHTPLEIPVELGKALGLAVSQKEKNPLEEVANQEPDGHELELDWFEMTEIIDDLGDGKVPTYAVEWCKEIAPLGAFEVKFKGINATVIECSDFDTEEKYLRAYRLMVNSANRLDKSSFNIKALDYSGCGPGVKVLCSEARTEFAKDADVHRLLSLHGGARRSAVRDIIAQMDEFGENKSYLLLWDGVKSTAYLAYEGRTFMSLRLDSCPEVKKLILDFIVKWPGPFLVRGRVKLKTLSRSQIPTSRGVYGESPTSRRKGSVSSRSSDRSSLYTLPGGNVYNLLDLYDPDGNANAAERGVAVARWAKLSAAVPKLVKASVNGGFDYPRPLS